MKYMHEKKDGLLCKRKIMTFFFNLNFTILIYFKIVEPNEKFHNLLKFLQDKITQKHIVFMSSCAAVQYFSKLLKQ